MSIAARLASKARSVESVEPVEIYTVLKFKWTTQRDKDYKNDIKEYGSYRNVDDAYVKLMRLVNKDYAEENGVSADTTDHLPDYVFTRVADRQGWREYNRHRLEAVENQIRSLTRDYEREMEFLGEDEFSSEMEKDLVAKNGGVYDDAVSEELTAAIVARYQAGLNHLLQPYLVEAASIEQELSNYPHEWLSPEELESLENLKGIKFRKVDGKWYTLGSSPISRRDYKDFFSEDSIETSVSFGEYTKYGTRYFIIRTLLH